MVGRMPRHHQIIDHPNNRRPQIIDRLNQEEVGARECCVLIVYTWLNREYWRRG